MLDQWRTPTGKLFKKLTSALKRDKTEKVGQFEIYNIIMHDCQQ